MNRFTPLLLLGLLGCVANVVGPTGAPLTDSQIEQLARSELRRSPDVECRWRHADTDTALAAGRHERSCPSAGSPSDSTRDAVTYAQDRHGRWTFRIGNRFVGERCRVERESREELGTLHCWYEYRY